MRQIAARASRAYSAFKRRIEMIFAAFTIWKSSSPVTAIIYRCGMGTDCMR
jgi:predicted transcriptional regulator